MRSLLPIRSLIKPLFAGVAILALYSCGYSEQIAKVKSESAASVGALQQSKRDLETQVFTLNKDVERLWREVRCTNKQVAEFLNELRNCDSDTCAARNIEQMISIMLTEKHVLLHLRATGMPLSDLNTITPLRKEQLHQKLAAEQITPVSRVLLMTMPLNLKAKQPEQDPNVNATITARYFKKYLTENLKLATDTPIMGPYPVTCKNKSQLMERYARLVPEDKAVKNDEPGPRDPQIAIWVFKVDC